MRKGMWGLVKIGVGLGVLALFICGFEALFEYWPGDPAESKKLKEVIETYRNLGLLLAGFLAVLFAWHRSRFMDRQTEYAGKDDRRKDRERVEERLEGAVRLLTESTDSVKHFAIEQLVQIGTDHPEKMPSAVRCLCGQTKEYDPHFTETELQLIKGDAENEREIERGKIRSALMSKGMGDDAIKKPTDEEIRLDNQTWVNIALRKKRKKRFPRMVKRLVKAINGLALGAGQTHSESWILYTDAKDAPIELQGVEIPCMKIWSLIVTPDRFVGCTFINVTFVNCTFVGDFGEDSKFRGCKFQDCNFGISNQQSAQFKGSDFSGSEFLDCTFQSVVWYGCPMTLVQVWRTKISKKLDSIFTDCDMTRVIFHFAERQTSLEVPKGFCANLRRHYVPGDFQKNHFVATSAHVNDAAEPQGLGMVYPKIQIETPSQNVGKRIFDVTLI